jgi:hypothetical protein
MKPGDIIGGEWASKAHCNEKVDELPHGTEGRGRYISIQGFF